MRPIAPLLAIVLALAVAAAAVAACGSSSPGNPTPDGGVVILPPDAGSGVIPTCPASDKPVGVSAATASPVQHLTPGTPAPVGTVLQFNVPANTASITIVEQSVNAPDAITFNGRPLENTAVPLSVKGPAPTGEVWYDDNTAPPNPEAALAFFASSSPATGTLTLPNTSAALARIASGSGALPPGTWNLTVSDYAFECSLAPNASACGGSANTSSTYDVTVITKPAGPGGGVPTTGTLDVTFHVVGTKTASLTRPLPTSAAAVEQDADIVRMVSTLRSIYAASNVTIGSVRFVDVPADVRATYSGLIDVDSSGACTPLAQLLKTGTDGTSIHIFLVNGFTATGLPKDAVVAGVDGTIPGPATVGGTVASGAAVGTSDLRGGTGGSVNRCAPGAPVSFTACGDDLTAMIVAHEMGHFLGLYHVTELDGFEFDPIGDSPRCPCNLCKATTATDACSSTASGHAMTTAECSGANVRSTTDCGGGDNLMFWFTPTSLTALSPGQQAVVRANPQVQ